MFRILMWVSLGLSDGNQTSVTTSQVDGTKDATLDALRVRVCASLPGNLPPRS